MGFRQFDTIAPLGVERSPTHRANRTGPEATRSTGQGSLFITGIPASGRTAVPRAQAQALTVHSGGRLARAGQVLFQLQQQYGNRYVQRVLAHTPRTATAGPAIQARLMIGAVGDRAEREADRVADAVVRERNHGVTGHGVKRHGVKRHGVKRHGVKRHGVKRHGVKRHGVKRHSAFSPTSVIQRTGGTQGGAVDRRIQQGIQRARTGGQLISNHVRTPMESAFGANFRGVRLHTDDRADQLNRALRARAFTTGQDIFFRRGEYRPGSDSTRRLLAHELTHVVQQNPSVVGGNGRRRSAAWTHDSVQFPQSPPRRRP